MWKGRLIGLYLFINAMMMEAVVIMMVAADVDDSVSQSSLGREELSLKTKW